MKHIKTFENFLTLKKYILWNGTDGDYYIFETGIKYNSKCEIFYKYWYNRKNKKLISTEKENANNSYSIDNYNLIIFQSNDIQDCIDEIYTLENIDKYNL